MNLSTRLVLKYDEGSFSISRLNPVINNDDAWALATAINTLQVDEVQEIQLVEKFLLI